MRAGATLKRAVAWGILRSGLLSLHRAQRERGRAVILLYHRIGDDGDPFFPALPTRHLVEQLEHVGRHYRVEPLETVVEWLESGADGPPRVAITIDDGYPDTHDVVLPVLERMGLPATLFLCTGPVETGRPVWSERARAIVARARGRTLDLPRVGLPGLRLDTTEARLDACSRLLTRLKQAPPGLIADALARAEEQLDPRPFAPAQLSWDHVRRLARGPVRIGAHTHNHYLLAHLEDREIEAEIATSIGLIEARIGTRPRTFAYPNGQPGDYDARSARILQSLGVRCALSSRHGVVGPHPDLWEIPRIYTTEPWLPLFAARLSGLQLSREAHHPPRDAAEDLQ